MLRRTTELAWQAPNEAQAFRNAHVVISLKALASWHSRPILRNAILSQVKCVVGQHFRFLVPVPKDQHKNEPCGLLGYLSLMSCLENHILWPQRLLFRTQILVSGAISINKKSQEAEDNFLL